MPTESASHLFCHRQTRPGTRRPSSHACSDFASSRLKTWRYALPPRNTFCIRSGTRLRDCSLGRRINIWLKGRTTVFSTSLALLCLCNLTLALSLPYTPTEQDGRLPDKRSDESTYVRQAQEPRGRRRPPPTWRAYPPRASCQSHLRRRRSVRSTLLPTRSNAISKTLI